MSPFPLPKKRAAIMQRAFLQIQLAPDGGRGLVVAGDVGLGRLRGRGFRGRGLRCGRFRRLGEFVRISILIRMAAGFAGVLGVTLSRNRGSDHFILVSMAQRCHFVTLVAIATSAFISGIALGGAGGLRHSGSVAMRMGRLGGFG